MPAITFTGKGPQAVTLFNYSMLLKGDPAQFRERAKLRDTLLKAWPELDRENPEDRPEEKDWSLTQKEASRQKRLMEETRSFDISATQRTALAEGFLKYIQDREVGDADKEAVLSLAKKVKCVGFLDGHLAKAEIREFAESDEEIAVDAEDAHG